MPKKTKTVQLNIDASFFNEAYVPYIDTTTRFNVFFGGAGSGKSHFVVQKMILKMLKYSNRKCLVVRKVQATLRETIFALFKEQLSTMNLLQHCSVTSTNMKIILPNGSEFIFMGLDDPEKIKSITGIDDILIEEATDLNKEDFTQLNLRLRSKASNQQIHMMFNPVSKENWIYGYFFKDGTPADTTIVHTNYKDNPHLPEGYIKTLLSYKDKSEIDYQVYALGEWGVRGKRVFNNWKVGKFDYREIIRTNPNIEVRFSLDFG